MISIDKMNTFGRFFRIHIWGESHGAGVGISIDGCPPGIALSVEDFSTDLLRRKSGARGTTPRIEGDLPEIFTGVYKGFTTGAPLTILFHNENTRSSDYEQFINTPRPGHADFTSGQKYKGFNDPRGSGHFSGRVTLGLVAAGVVAKKMIAPAHVEAKLIEVGGSMNIAAQIEAALADNDSVGGLVSCTASNLPVGWGEPFFDSAESLISHLIFSIPATKGIEFGSGFAAARMRGSQHNDPFISEQGTTESNHAGGINGGITNGNNIVFRVAIKPTSSIGRPQQTFNFASGTMDVLKAEGRHDACIALRIPVIIESATAIALADLMLASKTSG